MRLFSFYALLGQPIGCHIYHYVPIRKTLPNRSRPMLLEIAMASLITLFTGDGLGRILLVWLIWAPELLKQSCSSKTMMPKTVVFSELGPEKSPDFYIFMSIHFLKRESCVLIQFSMTVYYTNPVQQARDTIIISYYVQTTSRRRFIMTLLLRLASAYTVVSLRVVCHDSLGGIEAKMPDLTHWGLGPIL